MADLLIPTRRFFTGALLSLLAAPAIVRATSIMRVKALPPELAVGTPLESWGFESFMPPPGKSYQWNTITIFGEPDFANYGHMFDSGWRPVPASDWTHKFAIDDTVISRGGLVLMERPAALTAEAMAETHSKAAVSAQLKQVASGFAADLPEGYVATGSIRRGRPQAPPTFARLADNIDDPSYNQSRFTRMTSWQDVESWARKAEESDDGGSGGSPAS